MNNFYTFFLLLSTLFATAQDYPEKRPELLLGKELRVIPIVAGAYEKVYSGFYTDDKMLYTYKDNGHDKTVADAFGSGTLKVLSVDAVDRWGSKMYRIKLQNAAHETIYYLYDPNSDSDYKFEVVGGLTLPAEVYCDLVIESKDTEKGNEMYIFSGLPSYQIYKTKSATNSSTVLTLYIYKDEVHAGKGVVINLDNNQKIERLNLDIVFDTKRSTPRYSASIVLTSEEIELLKNHIITTYKLSKFEDEMYKKFAVKLKGAVSCLITK